MPTMPAAALLLAGLAAVAIVEDTVAEPLKKSDDDELDELDATVLPELLHMEKIQTSDENWAIFGPRWEGNVQTGLIQPSIDLAEDGNLAVWTKQGAFTSFDLSYSFYMSNSPMADWSSPGIVFGYKNNSHYYVVDVPSNGQQMRGESQWGTVSLATSNGLRRGLILHRLPGVTSTPGPLPLCIRTLLPGPHCPHLC
jgi:hypothetical protein